jgi:hypothetical protein
MCAKTHTEALMQFEDRVAQYILAILYSHYHLDVSLHQIPHGPKPSKMPEASVKQINESRVRGGANLRPFTEGFANAKVTMLPNPDIGLVHHRLTDKERTETLEQKPTAPLDVKYKGSEVYENTAHASSVGVHSTLP